MCHPANNIINRKAWVLILAVETTWDVREALISNKLTDDSRELRRQARLGWHRVQASLVNFKTKMLLSHSTRSRTPEIFKKLTCHLQSSSPSELNGFSVMIVDESAGLETGGDLGHVSLPTIGAH